MIKQVTEITFNLTNKHVKNKDSFETILNDLKEPKNPKLAGPAGLLNNFKCHIYMFLCLIVYNVITNYNNNNLFKKMGSR